MATTPFLGITLLEEAQADKEVTINTAIEEVDDFLANPTFTDTVTVDVPVGADPVMEWKKGGTLAGQVNSNGDLDYGNVYISVLRGSGATAAPSVGMNTITPATDTAQTVGSPQSKDPYQRIDTGAWTADRTVILPTKTGAFYWVHNNTAFATVTFKTAAGTGVAVGAGKHAQILCGGANYLRLTPDA